MRVVLVGGGIGGVAAAAELERVGIEWVLLERTAAPSEVGAGLQISSNATKVLARLGLEPDLAAIGVRARANRMVDLATGELIAVAPLGTQAAQAYGGTFYQVHRADLLALLTGAVPAERMRTGAEVVGISQSGGGVQVTLADGSVEEGDVAVGADGIHSFVARELHGDEEPEFSGVVAWRALIPREQVADLAIEENSNGFLGRGRSIVMYWVRGGELLNVVALMPSSEVRRESWTSVGDTDALRAGFARACPLVTTVLDRIAGNSFITGVYSRRPRPWWTDGRITLLGDAAHPMQPYLAQGACQALEDAAVLADALLATRDDPAAALAVYEARRRPRSTKVQVIAAASALIWNETDPVQTRARNGRFAGLAQLDPLARTVWGWLYQHDPTSPADTERGLETADATASRHRPEARRAFDLWRSALRPEHHAGGWRGLRRGYDNFLTTSFPPTPGVRVEEIDAAGVRCLRVIPAGGAGRGLTVLHLHGGGYVVGSARGAVELATRLAEACGGVAVIPDYRLAPEHPFPSALDDAVTAFRRLVEADGPGSVVVTGESAGAGLAAAMLLRLRDEGERAPLGAYLVSPFADLTLSGTSMDGGRDPVVDRDLLTGMAASYLQHATARDPYLSPVFGHFAGCPPILLHAAGDEALADDARRLADQVERTGGTIRAEYFDDSVHIFPLFPFLPETTAALGAFGAFVAELVSPVDDRPTRS